MIKPLLCTYSERCKVAPSIVSHKMAVWESGSISQ